MASRPATVKRRGRRRGTSGTRETIAAAARRLFGERGYDRVSLRAIGAEAGVDPGLVLHFFGSKEGLFVEVTGLPVPPEEAVARLVEGDPGEAGLRLAGFVVDLLEDPAQRARMTAIVRTGVSHPGVAELLRERLLRQLTLPVAEALGSEHAALRANLVGSQVVGLVVARHIVGIEPLASAAPGAVVAAVAPTLQRYLTGPLD